MSAELGVLIGLILAGAAVLCYCLCAVAGEAEERAREEDRMKGKWKNEHQD